MAIFRTLYSKTPNLKILQEAAKIINNGGLVIFPTDTVYGLGCLSTNFNALNRFSKIKGIKLENAPLSFLFKDISELSNYVAPMNSSTFKLLKKSLPGPFAFIMNAAQKLPKPFQKRKKIGIRISSDTILKHLLPLLSAPLITSSLHDPDEVIDYTTDPDILFEFWESKIDMMLSNGFGGNIPSTVIDLTLEPFNVIREGLGSLEKL
jgi:tRNA threonylcarbamoyl adenosine modification protein (Sua5/YciO/YrdC/YwlC family)